MSVILGAKEKKVFRLDSIDGGLETRFYLIKEGRVTKLRCFRKDGVDMQLAGKRELRKLAKAILAEVGE